jgi:SOS-response transcriptional repressor LexA
LRVALDATPMEPENSEIVAVAVSGEEAVTLKRFRSRGEQVSFEPESTNPEHKPFIFKKDDKHDAHFRIMGILVALLKPA